MGLCQAAYKVHGRHHDFNWSVMKVSEDSDNGGPAFGTQNRSLLHVTRCADSNKVHRFLIAFLWYRSHTKVGHPTVSQGLKVHITSKSSLPVTGSRTQRPGDVCEITAPASELGI